MSESEVPRAVAAPKGINSIRNLERCLAPCQGWNYFHVPDVVPRVFVSCIRLHHSLPCSIFQNGFESLRHLLPSLSQNPDSKVSKAQMLQQGDLFLLSLYVTTILVSVWVLTQFRLLYEHTDLGLLLYQPESTYAH